MASTKQIRFQPRLRISLLSCKLCLFCTCYRPEFRELPHEFELCQPDANEEEACAANLYCCSDDPSTYDGQIPQYSGSTYKGGIPLFSEANNELSHSGMCFNIEANNFSLANRCPIPCNPQWEPSTLELVCGLGSCCLQTQQVDPDKDCVFDQSLGKWRAVTGYDLFRTDIHPQTFWSPTDHTTHQDPEGRNCQIFTQDSDPNSPANLVCYQQLTVANQRGFCHTECPCVEDLCDLKNHGAVLRCTSFE